MVPAGELVVAALVAVAGAAFNSLSVSGFVRTALYGATAALAAIIAPAVTGNRAGGAGGRVASAG
jgi:hypothetical protein